MSLQYVQGDVLQSRTQVVVVPVNCVGVAGKGLALQCKQRFPAWFQVYRSCCQERVLWLGHPVIAWEVEPLVMCFPTKRHYHDLSRLVDIEAGLLYAVRLCATHNIASIAFPKLGCGAGGLAWEEVQPLMEYYLGQLFCEVLIYV